MAHNLGTEKQRRESTKAKLNGELVDAKNRLKKAKDNANVSMIKAIRQEVKDIQENLNNLHSNTHNVKAEVESLQQEIEIKTLKVKEFDAQFDGEFELLKQCELLTADILQEIRDAADLEEEEYDEERLDELDRCKTIVASCTSKLLERPYMAVRIKQRDETLQDANEADALKRWIDKVADTRIDLQMKFPKYGKACFCSSRRTLVLHDACVANDLNTIMTIVRRGYVDLNEQDKEGYSAVEHMVVRRCDFDDVLKAVHLFSKCDGKVDVLQNGCSNVARYCGWILK